MLILLIVLIIYLVIISLLPVTAYALKRRKQVHLIAADFLNSLIKQQEVLSNESENEEDDTEEMIKDLYEMRELETLKAYNALMLADWATKILYYLTLRLIDKRISVISFEK